MKKDVFLRARWEYLVMMNYEVDPLLLIPYLPAFTEIDRFGGKVYMSVVGFLFNDTRVFGLRWPMHTNFEEVNLRFYIRYHDGREWKRGVTFVSEVVPSPVISTIANTLYNERYCSASMRHQINSNPSTINVSYEWKLPRKNWNRMEVECLNQPSVIPEGSIEEFIFEHYYGYNRVTESTTIEYAVEHPRWEVFPVKSHSLTGDFASLYGPELARFIDGAQPDSVMLARGSEVIVRKPIYLRSS